MAGLPIGELAISLWTEVELASLSGARRPDGRHQRRRGSRGGRALRRYRPRVVCRPVAGRRTTTFEHDVIRSPLWDGLEGRGRPTPGDCRETIEQRRSTALDKTMIKAGPNSRSAREHGNRNEADAAGRPAKRRGPRPGEERMNQTKLTFGPPDVIVERRPDGALMARSPHPLGAYPRAVTDWLDHWAGVAPDRVFLAEREGEAWRKLTYRGSARVGAQHRARLDRSRAFRRPAGRDPFRQQRRSRARRTWRDDRRRPLRARLGPLFAHRQGFRQAEGDHRASDAGPRLRQRRRALRRGDRRGRAARTSRSSRV